MGCNPDRLREITGYCSMNLTADTEPTITDFADSKARIRQRYGKLEPELVINYTDEELEQLWDDATSSEEVSQIEARAKARAVKLAESKLEPKPELVIVKLESVIVKSKSKLTNKDLISGLDKIYKEVAAGKYSKRNRELSKKINIELSKRNISPAVRNASKFDRIACKNSSRSLYMNDLKTFELQWLYVQYKGHEVDNEAMNKLYKDIFTKPQFDWEQAMQIAIGSYVDKNGATKYLKTESKLRHLNLPECWQHELLVLQSKKVRNVIKNGVVRLKRAQHKENAKDAELRTASIDVRHRLEIYAASGSSRMKSIDVYVNIWMSIQRNGGDKSKLVGIMKSYETFGESSITKTNLRRKILYLGKAGIL